jgi:hypothetical protein
MSIVIALDTLHEGMPLIQLVAAGSGDDEDSKAKPLRGRDISRVEQLISALPQAPDRDAHMQHIGAALTDLLRSHPAIAARMKQKLHPFTEQEEPIYLYFKSPMTRMERWPWEAMYEKDVHFLSKNRSFPIARSQCCRHVRTEWPFEPPLRILAVLGAGGDTSGQEKPITGKAQWKSLCHAVRQSGLPVKLRVLTCERLLKNSINRQRLGWASADLIPPSGPAREGHEPPEAGFAPRDLLFDYIKAYAPHILHIFSHASANPQPQLQVATYKDWELGQPGSILIDSTQVTARANSGNSIWLVTLNCCESAMDAQDGGPLSMSVAAALARQGIPAALGMRERIQEDFAGIFSYTFYQNLLEDLKERIARVPSVGGLVDVHWASGLLPIRQLVGKQDKSLPEWTLPVMHAAYDFKLMIKGSAPQQAPAPAQAPAPPQASSNGKKRGHGPRHLSAATIKLLEDERLQLNEERTVVAGIPSVVEDIDQRIARIEEILRPASGVPHATTSSSFAAGNQRV